VVGAPYLGWSRPPTPRPEAEGRPRGGGGGGRWEPNPSAWGPWSGRGEEGGGGHEWGRMEEAPRPTAPGRALASSLSIRLPTATRLRTPPRREVGR